MASPTARTMTYDVQKGQDTTGAIRTFWMRFPGLSAASDCDSAGILYYLENPWYQKFVVLRAFAAISTLDAQDGDIDMGIEDDTAGTDSLSQGALICDSLVNTAAGVLDLMATQAVTGQARPIWYPKGSSAGAYLTITQNGDADVSALRWSLILEVAYYDDMFNTNISNQAVSVA